MSQQNDLVDLDSDLETEFYERTLPDVTQMLKYAKIDKNNLTEITQAVYFPKVTSNDLENYMLLETNPTLVADIERGETLYLKGGLQEKAVLCSDQNTYDIKIAEISNSLLLVPDLKLSQQTNSSPLKNLQDGMNKSLDRSLEDDEDENEDPGSQVIPFKDIERKEIKKVFHEYFECTLIKPQCKKTMDILQLTKYSGPENEYKIEKKLLFTYQQLLDTAQCSNAEFSKILRLHRAIDLDGHIRVLDYSYEYRVLTLMMNLMIENSWELNDIDEEETISALDGIAPSAVVTGLFNIYTEPSSSSNKFRYKEDLVSKIILLNILKPDLKFNYEEFMQTWRDAMPEGMTMDEKQLKGIGIIDKTSQPPCIKSLHEEFLPTNLHDRLRALFRAKDKWTLEEIEPYIEFFTTPQLGVTMILSKFSRSLTIDGVRVYVSKH